MPAASYRVQPHGWKDAAQSRFGNSADTAELSLASTTRAGGIRIDNLSVRFDHARHPVTALENVKLAIAPGEFVALLGPSGCGKSTLLNVIAGFQEPTAGRVIVDEEEVRQPGADRAVVFQHHSLFPWMSVLENVAFGPRMMDHAKPLDAARQYLDLVGLRAFAHHYPASLSGGMRQRVGLARALAVEPAVLLMDEPFGALDAQTRNLMQEQLIEIWARTNNTVVFVTHDIDEAIFLADRVVVLGVKPNRICGVFPVELPRPRTPGKRRSQRYQELQETLFGLIREESLKSFHQEH